MALDADADGSVRSQSSVKNVFIRGSVVRYVHLPGAAVDTALLEDATRRGKFALILKWLEDRADWLRDCRSCVTSVQSSSIMMRDRRSANGKDVRAGRIGDVKGRG